MLEGCRNIFIYLMKIVRDEFNRHLINSSLNHYNTKLFINIRQKYELHQSTNIIRKW